MNEHEFKKTYKHAACTERPWKYLIPLKERDKVIQQVRQECLQIYGHDFEVCPKLQDCNTNDCIGRPLEWNSPTARPYLEEFAKLHNFNKDAEFFISNCNTCPIAKDCSSPCFQVNNFINRHKSKEPPISYRNNIEEVAERLDQVVEKLKDKEFRDSIPVNKIDMPWDCLSATRQQVVNAYMLEHKDFKYVANKCGLNNQATAKYEFYAALTKMAKVGAFRGLLNSDKPLTDHQRIILQELFVSNLTLLQVADKLGITKQAVQGTVAKVVKKYDIRWNKFVSRKNGKLTYLVPEIVK